MNFNLMTPEEKVKILAETVVKMLPMQFDDRTIQDVFATYNEDQKKVLYYMVGLALEEGEMK